ncbi:carbohydrate ABC transporter permease [Amycolatopsis sp. CA-126428]|uniref:carbohydrate ABC transporter permease n=1 Tax=Amycolatopsis sp. CA-126428 TaxID=2073158 RepID=UPI0018EC098D|nr:sugar ABC transporter permease [Amycolatopsis sp. CA-126428]
MRQAGLDGSMTPPRGAEVSLAPSVEVSSRIGSIVRNSTPSLPAAGRSSRPPRARRGRSSLAGFLFAAPFFVGFLLVFAIPFGYALYQSLFVERKSGTGFGGTRTEFAGLANFVRGLTDSVFWQGIFRVSVFAVVQIPITLGLALLMALLLDAVHGRTAKVFRLGFLIPYMIPLMVGTLVWLYLYSPRLGPLTDLGHAFGVDVDFFSSGMLWLSIGNLLTWCHLGFNMLILYSALRSVPRELFEAARIDGASELRVAWSVKVPYVRGTLVLTGMLSIIGMLQIFNEPLVFQVSSPETVTSAFTPIMMIYNQAFVTGNYNYAAALSVVLAIIVGAASTLFYRLTSKAQ